MHYSPTVELFPLNRIALRGAGSATIGESSSSLVPQAWVDGARAAGLQAAAGNPALSPTTSAQHHPASAALVCTTGDLSVLSQLSGGGISALAVKEERNRVRPICATQGGRRSTAGARYRQAITSTWHWE